jgi:copper chaperone CopZ
MQGGIAMAIELSIVGMSCEHCAKEVLETLLDVPGVEAATVELKTHSATIHGSPSIAELVSALAAVGYATTLKAPPDEYAA